MQSSLTCEFVRSCDLMNSSHLDSSDLANGIVTWIEHIPGLCRNWFFVMENVTIDGKRGLVIPIYHGLSLSWDATIIRHCSSFEDVGENNHLNGFFWREIISLIDFCKKKLFVFLAHTCSCICLLSIVQTC